MFEILAFSILVVIGLFVFLNAYEKQIDEDKEQREQLNRTFYGRN